MTSLGFCFFSLVSIAMGFGSLYIYNIYIYIYMWYIYNILISGAPGLQVSWPGLALPSSSVRFCPSLSFAAVSSLIESRCDWGKRLFMDG